MTVQQITEEAQLNQALNQNEAILLKHSLTCPISAEAKGHVESFATNHEIPAYIIHIQENRDLSNQVAEELNIKHQSPQVFYIKQGNVEYHTSHFEIKEDQLENVVQT
ncbi:bacillithiol system redox-active protein YtxJ [Alkalibacillus almallahensis]|uniref:bacillithiol system redox-active protein YtxJ n=1 Tax=Alkalibacillus almallahensis TaxID=1379154 RepID=UPI001423E6DE|nr:bacillithiol system redox-active protein YtxJ [Alkalibacillus almallahensis]NIK11036.1 bacillithiol system protein YtxJ [Alkalibacillus almallahensis]